MTSSSWPGATLIPGSGLGFKIDFKVIVADFKKQLEAPTKEAQRKMLLTLLAEEEAKEQQLVAKPKHGPLDPR